ncbi:MAG: protein kinase [Eubacteriales bacterium]|nr:protein kinase [Eubacteriales bacterium]
MDNRTVINPALQQSAQTVINNEIIEEYNRQNNIDISMTTLVREGATILEKYVVTSRLEVASGEADLYLCKYNHGDYVAKIYKRQFAIKQEVVNALLKIDSPYVAKLHETGTYNGYPVEILPYYENGSLQGKTFSEDELVKRIIPNINEGLHAIHEAGIIHKDLKPSNIMLNSDGETVSIIDFGISSAVEGNKTILVTKTGMTPEYSAPETFKNIFYEGSDYYSFGITLFELFCGYTPYANMQPEEIEQFVSVQRIPFPEEMSALLQDFISALTYYDISFRKNKNNPNRRWTYEEVCKWLNGEPLVIPGEGVGNIGKGAMPAYQFLGESYTDPALLVAAFAKNWEDGKKQLFRGYITAHFRTYNQDIARKCQAAEEEAGRENGRDDIIFWKLLYQINPKLKGFYWKGYTYESIPAFGRDVLEKLWDRDHSQFPYYASILEEKLLTQYVLHAQPKNEKLKNAAAAIEDSYELEKNNGTDMRRTYYLMAYTLSGQKLLLLDGEQFRTVGELVGYMRTILEESYDRFESLCHRLVDYDGNLDFQLETWLMAIGKQKELEAWRTSMNE